MNTVAQVGDLLSLIHTQYGGVTYSRRSFVGPFWGEWDNQPPENTMVIICDLDPVKHPQLLSDMTVFEELIREMGEKEPWVTFHTIYKA